MMDVETPKNLSKLLLAASAVPSLQDALAFAENPKEASRSLMMQILVGISSTCSEKEQEDYYKWLKTLIFDTNSDISRFITRIVSKQESCHKTVQDIREDIFKFFEKDAIPCEELIGRTKPYCQSEESEAVDIKILSGQADGFLYENPKEFMVKNGFASRHRCEVCGSTATKYLPLVSHSSSIESLVHLFGFGLKNLQGKKLLDIGSGLGSILYGACYLSESSEITGIEINSELCGMVSQILNEYDLVDRVRVINGDLKDYPELLKDQDVVFFNNSFEYFVTPEEQIKLWEFIRDNMKAGSMLVTNPTLFEILKPLNLCSFMDEWVDETIVSDVDDDVLSGLPQPDEKFHVYIVK